MSVPAFIAKRLVPHSAPVKTFAEATHEMATASGHLVGVRFEEQLGKHWCWAAVSVAMRAFVRKDLPALSQCQLAKIHLRHDHDCCATSPPADECDQEAALEDTLPEAGVAVQDPTGSLTFFELTAELTASPNRPVCAMIDFADAPKHFVQIDGFQNDGSIEYIINDPQRGVLTMPASDFETNYHNENGRWRKSYLLA